MTIAQGRAYRILPWAFSLCLVTNVASAAPPSSCVCKFVGEWSYPGGTTTVFANGTAKPVCVLVNCTQLQTWTCQGNIYYFSNGSAPPGQFQATLIDANHMQYSGGIATRTRAGSCSVDAGKHGTKCAMPSAGKTIHQGDAQCIQATNGNSDPKCKYRFTYISSITKRMVGPVVDPGKTDVSVCGRPGETLKFEKWEQVPPSAQ
jgi:hypothetical protein